MAIEALVRARGTRSQREIAQAMNAAGDETAQAADVSRMENGQVALGPRFVRYGRALGLSVDDLIAAYEQEAPAT